jgi:hypothetical protein
LDDQRTNTNGCGLLTPRNLLAIAIAYLGVTYLSGGAMFVLGMVTGPLASPIVGAILLFIAYRIYRRPIDE